MSCDALAVPTCAYLGLDAYYQRVAHVNDGVGWIIANEYPDIRYEMVRRIEQGGNTVCLLTGNGSWRSVPTIGSDDRIAPYHLINFPVKPGFVYLNEDGIEAVDPDYQEDIDLSARRVPGYMSRVRLGIVEESVKELLVFMADTDWANVGVPRFEEHEVNDYLKSVLDDRFFLACL